LGLENSGINNNPKEGGFFDENINDEKVRFDGTSSVGLGFIENVINKNWVASKIILTYLILVPWLK